MASQGFLPSARGTTGGVPIAPQLFDGSKEAPSERLHRQLTVQRTLFFVLALGFLLLSVPGLL